MTEWCYSAAFSPERVSALLAPATMGTIAERVAEAMEIVCCHYQVCDDHRDFGRVVYCLRISEDLFDLFFNSPHGYRGAYFRSPTEGIEANRTVMEVIAPRLISASEHAALHEERNWLRESLTSYSSKVWLAENGLGLCPHCEGEWAAPADDVPEILNGRWEMARTSYGRKAPRFTKIRVFGAFFDDHKNEFIPSRKRKRPWDIHNCGWA
ncbi:MAG: hypothetical protein AB1593_10405 [Pseudomonadota bacterium]